MTITDFHQCTNCGACRNVCPVDAISVRKDQWFYSPVVDAEKCIACGRCAEICSANHPVDRHQIRTAFAAQHRDPSVVRRSSSGGVFTALANRVLENQGVVFGASLRAETHEVVLTSTDEVSLDDLRRSKYVESNTGDSFSSVKAALAQNRSVLFCGSPCQVSGLYAFLGRDDENLLTCDFVCGGFASHKLFEEYLLYLEGKYGSAIRSVNFRPKTYGWREYAIQAAFQNGKEYTQPAKLDPYMSSFLYYGYSIRESCLNCRFAENHCADIILSDCWRASELTKLQDDNTGISLVFANTEKGERAIRLIQETIAMETLAPEQAGQSLKCRLFDEKYKQDRERFLNECERIGIVQAGYQMCQAKGVSAQKLKFKSAVKKMMRTGKIGQKTENNNQKGLE